MQSDRSVVSEAPVVRCESVTEDGSALLVFAGDVHRDCRAAALRCVLHGLSVHDGEQQQR